ncbi:hypothetical protein CW751_05570 [Brumimicrobium salinarum]|uniref:Uncharacterized protein n=2 Tax=Brumimicrobium salinarum TaxID=2058658 RepID=A0A2I0R411_9FLAO|nr:hypothetical protein CW751_05570 [Brumimicrobium salinarum]
MYKEWLYSLKKQNVQKFTNPIWYIAGIWLIGEFTFFDNFSKSVNFTLTMIGGGIVLLLLLIQIIVYFKLKKIKRH